MPKIVRRVRSLEDFDEAHLTVGEFARFLVVPTAQVWKWHDAGLLEVIIFESRRFARIDADEARRFMAVHRSNGGRAA